MYILVGVTRTDPCLVFLVTQIAKPGNRDYPVSIPTVSRDTICMDSKISYD